MAGKRRDNRSPEAESYRPLYKSARWLRLREAQLEREPLCERCAGLGKVVPATVAHHKTPHKGNLDLFFDGRRLGSLCEDCHNGPVQSFERTGIEKGCDAKGRPLDPGHPWHKPLT